MEGTRLSMATTMFVSEAPIQGTSRLKGLPSAITVAQGMHEKAPFMPRLLIYSQAFVCF